MNKFYLILLAFLLLSVKSYSQITPSWAWGEYYPISDVVTSTYHNDYIYMIGNYYNNIQIGSVTLSNAGGSDTYLAKWDTLGNLIWAKSISDTGSQTVAAIHINSNNEIVIAGNFTNPSLVIGNDTLFSGVMEGVYTATFDLSGNIINAFGIPSAYCTDFCLDNADNIYINTLNGLKKFTSSGVIIWQKPYGARYIQYSSLGSCIMGIGDFNGTITLGGTTITAGYSATWGVNSDIYAIQFDLNGNVNWLTQVTNTARADNCCIPYLQESTGDLFISIMTLSLSGQYVFIYKLSLSGVQSIVPFNNVASGVVIPSTFVEYYPAIFNISGRDSFLSFMLTSSPFYGPNRGLGVFNLNSQETVLSLNCLADYHLFRGLNSIYMKGSVGSVLHTFGKLGPPLLTSLNTYFTNHYCVGSSVNLTSNVVGGVPPYTYSWAPSTGLSSSTTNAVSFTVNTNITYILTVNDASGQVVKDTFDIIVDTPLNPLVITPQFSGFCHDSMYLFSNSGLSVNWYKYDGLNWNVNFPIFYNDSTIIYDIGLYRATISNYCNTVADTLQINPIAVVNANANSLNICTGQSLTLYGSGALTYTWSSGVINNIAFNPSMTQTYTVTGIDLNGCIGTDTINVEVNSSSSSTINTTICSSALPYVWNSQTLTSSGTYTATLLNANGCDSIASLNFVVNPSSTSTTNVTICSDALPYVWNSQTHTSSGTYLAYFVNAFGCDSIANLNLIVNPANASTTNISICSNALPYVWNSQSLTSSGIYTSSFINGFGCDSIETLNLTVNPTPQPTIIQNNYTLICTNASNVTYQWYFNGVTIGGNDSMLAITQDGQYFVMITDSAGCIGFDYLSVIGLGVDKIENDNLISIYPNPSSGLLNIHYSLSDNSLFNLKLMDVQGRTLTTILENKKPMSGTYHQVINLKSLGLTPGIYLLSGHSANHHWTKRIVYFE
ncbi:MAG TPA: T9SS type A sorting domain-containing protein [Chitinophagaceae bacterium]|nr:T9SS type A sorting domain-containing protein [Chitinophagaceae bacterium]